MTNANDAAFATIGKNPWSEPVLNGGLTKREYFAAMAMQGLLANSDEIILDLPNIGRIAVDRANELLEALNKDAQAHNQNPGEPEL